MLYHLAHYVILYISYYMMVALAASFWLDVVTFAFHAGLSCESPIDRKILNGVQTMTNPWSPSCVGCRHDSTFFTGFVGDFFGIHSCWIGQCSWHARLDWSADDGTEPCTFKQRWVRLAISAVGIAALLTASSELAPRGAWCRHSHAATKSRPVVESVYCNCF